MQRRNVDLPDPDGPSRHITSPCSTSRLMPFRTSRRPKRLWTPSAFTISSLISLNVAEAEPARRGGHLLRAREAAAEPPLEEVLADVQDARHHEIPDARHDQKGDLLVVDAVDELN